MYGVHRYGITAVRTLPAVKCDDTNTEIDAFMLLPFLRRADCRETPRRPAILRILSHAASEANNC